MKTTITFRILEWMTVGVLLQLLLMGCSLPNVQTEGMVAAVKTSTPDSELLSMYQAATEFVETWQANNPPFPEKAIIVTTDGKKITISNPEPEYCIPGVTLGDFYGTDLRILLFMSEGAEPSTQLLKYPFIEIRSIVLKGALIPDVLKPEFGGLDVVRIEMRNGSIVLLSDHLLIEMDTNGQQVQRYEIEDYLFYGGETISGGYIVLCGFEGYLITDGAKNGDFWNIHRSQIVSIEME